MIKDIVLLVVGGILGVVFTELYHSFKKYRKKNVDRATLRALNHEVLFDNDNYMALDHAIPFYKQENIKLNNSGEFLFLEISESYLNELQKYDFQTRTTTLYKDTTSLEELFSKMQIAYSEDLINTAKNEVAQEIIETIKTGVQRHNGEMYGVKNVRLTRTVYDEEAGFVMNLYTTDFYTYNVFANLYEKLIKSNHSIKVGNVQDLNTYAPFLSSFGVSGFVMINRGAGDEILIGKRSQTVNVDKGKWHFSMNEAFSLKDKDFYEKPSLEACFFRGIKEELGINEVYTKSHIRQWGFMDFDIDMKKFELGVTAFVKVRFNDAFTFKNLIELYKIAQDGKLETDTIFTLPFTDIDKFIEQHYSDISVCCRGALQSLNTRYKAGYFDEGM